MNDKTPLLNKLVIGAIIFSVILAVVWTILASGGPDDYEEVEETSSIISVQKIS